VYSQTSSCSCQYCGAFIAKLPILRSSYCTVAHREKQHSVLGLKSSVLGVAEFFHKFFSENLRDSLFNDSLSNEPNYSQMHLGGQYL
jgi:hypothetical protein